MTFANMVPTVESVHAVPVPVSVSTAAFCPLDGAGNFSVSADCHISGPGGGENVPGCSPLGWWCWEHVSQHVGHLQFP